MRAFIISLLIQALALLPAEARRWIPKIAAAGGSIASGDVFNETFEGTGYSAAGWTEGSGTPNEDSAIPGTPPAGSGSQCLTITKSSATEHWTRNDTGATSAADRYYRFYLYVTSESISNTDITSCFLLDSTTTHESVASPWGFMLALYQSGGVFGLQGFSQGPTLLGGQVTLSTATWYRVEVRFAPNVATTGYQLKVFDSGGTQVGSTQSGTAPNVDPRYYYLGTVASDNSAAITFSVDGFGVNSTGFLGQ